MSSLKTVQEEIEKALAAGLRIRLINNEQNGMIVSLLFRFYCHSFIQMFIVLASLSFLCGCIMHRLCLQILFTTSIAGTSSIVAVWLYYTKGRGEEFARILQMLEKINEI